MNKQNEPSAKNTNPSFELLNTINQQRQSIRVYVIALSLLCFGLLLSLIYVAQKPPLVIRIDKLGETKVDHNYAFETEMTTADDIVNFTNVFLNNYVALRSDLVVPQFHKSLNMMTPKFAKNHLKSMKENNTVRKIQAASVRNDLELMKPKIEIVDDTIYVNVLGMLHTRPLGELNAIPESKSLYADLILAKIKRTPDHPYGLLLTDIKVEINKETKGISNNLDEVSE